MFHRRITARGCPARTPSPLALVAIAMWSTYALAARDARAGDPKTARLRYVVHAPADVCPDESSFRSLVVARLGRDPFVPNAEGEMTVTVDATRKGVQGRLVIASGDRKPAERRFTEAASGCEPLVEAVATAAALALDPLGNASGSAPAAATTAAATAPPSTDASPHTSANGDGVPGATAAGGEAGMTEPAGGATTTRAADAGGSDRGDGAPVARANAPRLRFAARGSLVVGIALAPGTTAGGEVAVGFEREAFSIFLEGRAETQVTDARGTSGDSIEATLFGVGLAPCGRIGVLMGCLFGRAGVIQGSAPALQTGNLGSSAHVAIGPRIGVWVPIGRGLALNAGGEIVVPLVRTTFYVGGQPTWVAPPIAGGLFFGLGFDGP